MIISPSAIAISSVGLALSGDYINDSPTMALTCTVCGASIGEGQRYDDFTPTSSFTNQLALALPGGKHICGACKTVMTTGEFQMKFATGLFCNDGFFPIMRKEHRAWAFLTPPATPFVVTIQTAKQQHVVWRAPVTISRDLILVRVGEQIIRLRRQRLVSAREAALRLDEARKQADAGKSKKSAAPKPDDAAESPFVTDWKFQSTAGGVMKRWSSELIKQGAISESDKIALTTLNAGEVWALQAVLHRTPTKPEAVSINSAEHSV